MRDDERTTIKLPTITIPRWISRWWLGNRISGLRKDQRWSSFPTTARWAMVILYGFFLLVAYYPNVFGENWPHYEATDQEYITECLRSEFGIQDPTPFQVEVLRIRGHTLNVDKNRYIQGFFGCSFLILFFMYICALEQNCRLLQLALEFKQDKESDESETLGSGKADMPGVK